MGRPAKAESRIITSQPTRTARGWTLVPGGFEIYENVAGQVFLRRVQKKLITDEELEMTRAALTAHAEEWRHKIDVKKNILTVYETEDFKTSLGRAGPLGQSGQGETIQNPARLLHGGSEVHPDRPRKTPLRAGALLLQGIG